MLLFVILDFATLKNIVESCYNLAVPGKSADFSISE